MTKIVFIPGNGGCTTQSFWFPRLKSELESNNLDVVAADFPDSDLARESYWIPFLKDELKVGSSTVLVGHSTGAIAALRFAQNYPILGSVLVGAYHTDLGIEKEKQSEYFDTPWDWDKICHNQKWISVFASQDDPWIPVKEARYLHDQLNCEYHEFKNRGHFGSEYVPELTLCILNNLKPPK